MRKRLLFTIVGLALVNQLAWLTVIPIRWLAPVIFLLATLGAYVYKGRLGDVLLTFLFGAVGYYMKKYRWPRIALVIALVLGPLFETNFHITMQLQHFGRINFWSRPVAMVILGLTILSLLLPFLRRRRDHERGAARGPEPAAGLGARLFSLP